MFGELPKLLDRNYAIGFFLPAALLSGILWWTLGLYGLVAPVVGIAGSNALIGAAFATGLVWLVSILLMAVNGPATRMLQGYGAWYSNPLRWTLGWRKRRFRKGPGATIALETAREAARAGGTAPPHLPADHGARLYAAVEDYPDDEAWVLPTDFGNRMRAAEVYARAVYGLDPSRAWPRLQGLLSADFRELLNAAKAQLDFCVNLVCGGLTVALAVAGLAAWKGVPPGLWPLAVAAVAVLMVIVGYALAVQAVMQYGLYVRSAFDLYRGPLAEQLGLALPADAKDEQNMWRLVSQMFIYRSPQRFLDLGAYRKREEAEAAKPPAKPPAKPRKKKAAAARARTPARRGTS